MPRRSTPLLLWTPIGNTLWAVGAAGTIVRQTSTTGTSWVTVTSAATPCGSPNNFGVTAYDANIIVAVGSGGTICRTLDGGTTWAKIAVPAGAASTILRSAAVFL